MENQNPFPQRDPFSQWERVPTPPPVPAPRRLCAAAKALIAALVALAITITGSVAAVTGSMLMRIPEQTPSGGGGTSSDKPDSGGSEFQPEYNPNAPQVSIVPQGTRDEILSETEIAEKVRPSVVGIITYAIEEEGPVQYGEGSGVVLTADGYIITNAHVVDGGVDIRLMVVDYKGKAYDAELVGCDDRTDLAVIRITEKVTLIPAEFGDSSPMKVGDPVVAIGNPGGLSYASSVTYGRISAVDRVISTGVNVFGLFQIDAAINPGNSGGALVNQWGQVVAINCAKIVAEDYEGIGFAIPITKAKMVLDTLMEHGYMYNRVRLGISFVPVDTVTSAFENIPCGMQIVELTEDSIFARTKVRAGDVIVAVDGKDVSNTALFFETLFEYAPRDKAEFTIYRPETEYTVAAVFSVTVAFLGEYE